MAAEAAIPAAAEAALRLYTACDVCDDLLRLEVPRAGFLGDLRPYGRLASPPLRRWRRDRCARVVGALRRQGPAAAARPAHVQHPPPFPLGRRHPARILRPHPAAGRPDQRRVRRPRRPAHKTRGARGIAVASRVRDLPELRSTGLPILAYGSSAVGAAAASLPWALQVPLDVGGVRVSPGDIAFHDDNGLVVIPRNLLDQVLDLLPRLVAADDRVRDDVRRGLTLHDAFARQRAA